MWRTLETLGGEVEVMKSKWVPSLTIEKTESDYTNRMLSRGTGTTEGEVEETNQIQGVFA